MKNKDIYLLTGKQCIPLILLLMPIWFNDMANATDTSESHTENIPTLERLGIEKPPIFIEIEKALNDKKAGWQLFYDTSDYQAYANAKSVIYQPITDFLPSTVSPYLVKVDIIAYQPKTYRYLMGKFTINCAKHTLSGEGIKLLKLTGEIADIEPIVEQPIKPNGVWEKTESYVCPIPSK